MKKFSLLLLALICSVATTWADDTQYYKGDKVTTTTLEDGKYYIIEGMFKAYTGILYYNNVDGAMSTRSNIKIHSVSGYLSSSYVWKANVSESTFTLQSVANTDYYVPNAKQSTWNNEAGQFTLVAITSDNGDFKLKNSQDMVLHADGNGSDVTSASSLGCSPSFWGDGDDSDFGSSSSSRIAVTVYEAEEVPAIASDYQTLLTTATAAYNQTTLGDNLITDASQFDNTCGDSSEGTNPGNLIDGSSSTFWHSDWHGSCTEDPHWLGVTIAEVNGDIQLSLTRRAAASDHVTEFTVYGKKVSTDDWTELAVLSLPYASNTETKTAIFTDNGYTILKFAATATSTSRTYWHASEFQLNTVTYDRDKVATEAAALKTQLDAAVDPLEATQEKYDALNNAYTAYNAALEAAKTADYSEMNAALATAKKYTVGTGLNQYSETTAGTMATAIATAEAFDQTKTEKSLQTSIDAATTALNDAVAALSLNMPTKGMYLRFKGTNGKYVSGATTGTNAPMVELSGNEATTIFLYNEDGQFISYATGTGFTNTHTLIAEGASTTPHVFTFAKGVKIGTYQISSDYSGSKIWYDNTSKLDRNSKAASPNTDWTLEEVTMATAKMNIQQQLGCATFVAPFDVTLEDGDDVKAYTTEDAGTWVKLNEITDGKIPAATPVVVCGAADKDYELTITKYPTSTETAPVNGVLTGNLDADKVKVTPGKYVLQCNDNVTGWYQVADNGIIINCGVNRCYMNGLSEGARAFYPMATSETTGISSIATEAKTKADGKYLVNGKIVVVKAGKAYNMNGQIVK